MEKKRMRKIAVVTAMACAVAAMGIVAPTLAWLSDSSASVTNTFKGESVTVSIDEAPVDAETGKQIDGERVLSNDYMIVAGRVLDKDPTPTVKKGSVESAVYVKVTNGDPSIFTPNYDAENWTKISGDDESAVYRYSTTVNAYKTEDDVTLSPVFTTVTVSEDFTGLEDDVNITAQAYAVQAEGLVNGDDFTKADAQALSYFNVK